MINHQQPGVLTPSLAVIKPHTCSFTRLITVAVLPLVIYALQLLSKACILAAIAAGILVLCKVLIELLVTHDPGEKTTPMRPARPPMCHYCHSTHGALRLHPNPDHRLPPGTQVCEPCYLTRLLTAEYMSYHYEPL